VIAAIVALGLAAPASAAPVLLTPGADVLLQGWLGPVGFTNIYERQDGDTSADFHAASDGQGATVTLMQVVSGIDGSVHVIGGYNPQSWSSIGDFNYTPLDIDRTGFIFNITSGIQQTQRLTTDVDPTFGEFQTFNDVDSGPTFGGGNDIWVDDALATGFALQYSYGSGGTCAEGFGAADILGFSFFDGSCDIDNPENALSDFEITALEVYSISEVPEPATLALFATGMAALVVVRRRKRQA
jgi:hypothetical protein